MLSNLNDTALDSDGAATSHDEKKKSKKDNKSKEEKKSKNEKNKPKKASDKHKETKGIVEASTTVKRKGEHGQVDVGKKQAVASSSTDASSSGAAHTTTPTSTVLGESSCPGWQWSDAMKEMAPPDKPSGCENHDDVPLTALFNSHASSLGESAADAAAPLVVQMGPIADAEDLADTQHNDTQAPDSPDVIEDTQAGGGEDLADTQHNDTQVAPDSCDVPEDTQAGGGTSCDDGLLVGDVSNTQQMGVVSEDSIASTVPNAPGQASSVEMPSTTVTDPPTGAVEQSILSSVCGRGTESVRGYADIFHHLPACTGPWSESEERHIHIRHHNY